MAEKNFDNIPDTKLLRVVLFIQFFVLYLNNLSEHINKEKIVAKDVTRLSLPFYCITTTTTIKYDFQ